MELRTSGYKLAMMGRKPCYDSRDGLNKGPWTQDEDLRLTQIIQAQGEGRWPALAIKAGLKRCGKSCRFRWVNYLRPNLKRGNISPDEEELILRLHKLLGNRWSLIAGRIPGRTDNEVKNYWNTRLNKKAHANACIELQSVRPTEPNSKEPAASIITPTSADREGEREEVIDYPEMQDLKKASTSSRYPTKQGPSSSSDAGKLAGASAEMDLSNPLRPNFNILPSWAYSNFLHDDSIAAFALNPENVRPHSCMLDIENLCPDYIDQMYSILYSSLSFPEVSVHGDPLTVAPHMDELADFFNSF